MYNRYVYTKGNFSYEKFLDCTKAQHLYTFSNESRCRRKLNVSEVMGIVLQDWKCCGRSKKKEMPFFFATLISFPTIFSKAFYLRFVKKIELCGIEVG